MITQDFIDCFSASVKYLVSSSIVTSPIENKAILAQ